MTKTQITKEQAITVMRNILQEGCSIPKASVGNGDARLCFISPWPLLAIKDFVSYLRDKSFRIVPTSEISEKFGGLHYSEDYDVCVEFRNTEVNYAEQYLLWDIKYFSD